MQPRQLRRINYTQAILAYALENALRGLNYSHSLYIKKKGWQKNFYITFFLSAGIFINFPEIIRMNAAAELCRRRLKKILMMREKYRMVSIRFAAVAATFAIFAVIAALGISTASAKGKVTIVLIKAEWCSACHRVEPIVTGVKNEYGSKIELITLDVTDEESTAKSAAIAKSLGISGFFESNKRRTSTVGVFAGSRNVFKTSANYNRSDYVSAVEKALK